MNSQVGAVSTRANEILGSLQVGRGIAALLVVASHTSMSVMGHLGFAPFGAFFWPGISGVHYFFILSGFIICHAHYSDVGQPRTVGRYAWNRLVRVWPLYLVMLGATLAVEPPQPRDVGWEWQVSLLCGHACTVDQAWTLTHEVLFYAVFGLVLLHPPSGLVISAAWLGLVLAGTLGMVDPGGHPLIALAASQFNLLFALGAGLCALSRTQAARRHYRAALLAGLVALVGVWTLSWRGEAPPRDEGWLLLWALPYGLILLGLVGFDRMAPIRWPRWSLALGGASYAIYLTHYLVMVLGWYVAAPLLRASGPLAMPLLVAACVVVGVAVWRFVEMPAHVRLRRWRAR